MKSILTTVMAVVLLVVIILDGASMFMAYQSSRELARTAAQQAAIGYASTGGNESVARAEAEKYVTDKNGELLSLEFHRGDARNRWYSATVRMKANTYVFKFVPVLNRFIDQQGIATVQF
jgi:xanthine dehydrogenase molybdopterin-binding subunit B